MPRFTDDGIEFTNAEFDKASRLVERLMNDNDYKALLALVDEEMDITLKVIRKSPLLQKRGRSATKRSLAPDFEDFPRNKDEDWYDYLDRVDAEGIRRGQRLVMPYVYQQVTYWTLDVTSLVFVETPFIGKLDDDGTVKYFFLFGAPMRDLEEIIQGLRLLRTSFNGAVE